MKKDHNGHAPVLKTMLRQGKTVYVEFIKKDGTIRRMVCTTNMSRIPFCKHPIGANHDFPDHQIRVFDLMKQDWRSMDEDNIQVVSEMP